MKQFSKLFFAAAVAALGLASCAKEVAPVETPKDNLVTVHFGATAGIEGATKATLTPNEQETLFTSAWVNGDVLGVQYYMETCWECSITMTAWQRRKLFMRHGMRLHTPSVQLCLNLPEDGSIAQHILHQKPMAPLNLVPLVLKKATHTTASTI